MRAVDTNVVVRYLVADHPDQASKARATIDGTDVFVSVTVLLETEWVLRTTRVFDRSSILGALNALLGHPRVRVQNTEAVDLALTWARGGMDFADALHLALAGECETFVTFDRKLIKQAARLGSAVLAELP